MSVGIDFGTTNSVVARWTGSTVEVIPVDSPPGNWAGLGYDRVLPTVFGAGPSQEPIFGWAAKQRPGSLAAVKRLLRAEEKAEVDGMEFSVEEVATMIFGHLRRAAPLAGAPDFQHAVVTIPANSRGLARYRTKLCAGMAGIQVQALMNEPTAAAMAYSMKYPHDGTIMVVDWGGGTLDVTILRNIDGVFMEEASKGVQQLGGLDLDAALQQSIVETIPSAHNWDANQRNQFRLDVERVKILLSSQESVEVLLPDGSSRTVTRGGFETTVRTQLERVRDPILRCLADTKMSGQDINALVLVGGTCNIPLARHIVAETVGRPPAAGIDPMTAIAEGAAVASAILAGQIDDRDFFVSTEHALGTTVVDEVRERIFFDVLIPRNHKLPARVTKTYFPLRDYQEGLSISVLEGDPDLPIDHIDNATLKEWEVTIHQPGPIAETAIEITFAYDVDGILNVTATDSAGATLLNDDVSFGATADKSNLVRIAKNARDALDSGRLDDSSRRASGTSPAEVSRPDVVNTRTRILPFVDQAEARRIEEICDRVLLGDTAALEELKSVLSDYSYLL